MADATKLPTRARCPICKRLSEQEFRPFCSKRCSDVDLSRWLSGTYAIASRDDDDEDGLDLGGAAPLPDPSRKPN